MPAGLPLDFVSPDFVPPGLTRGKDHPHNQPHTLPLAPTQPPGPAAYEGPPLTSDLEGDVDQQEVLKAILRQIRHFREPHRYIDVYNPSIGGQTDSSGNAVVKLYDVAIGFQFAVHDVLVYLTSAATYNPSNPYAAAGTYAFLAASGSIATGQGGVSNAALTTLLYPGMIAFAPTSSAGPFLPGQWTFGTHDAPRLRGGSALFLCIVGAAAIASQPLSIDLGGRLVETP